MMKTHQRLLLLIAFFVWVGVAFAENDFKITIESLSSDYTDVQLMSSAFANVFTETEPLDFQLSMRNTLDVDQRLFGYFVLSDVKGKEIEVVRKSFSIPAKDEGKVAISFKTDYFGFFTLQGSIFPENGDGENIFFTTTLARIRNQVLKDTDSIFGICAHLLRYDEFQKQKDSIEIFSKIGVSSVRYDFYWPTVEYAPGKYKMSSSQMENIQELKKNGIEILPILCYDHPNYPGKVADSADAYGRYAGFVAENVAPYTDHIEIWNEWNGGFGTRGSNSPQEYTKMLKAASKEIKAAVPQMKVVGCSTVVIDHAWIEEVFKAGGGDYMDAVSIHPYRYPVSPEASGLVGELNKLVAVIDKYGGNQRIWCTETGYPVNENFSGLTAAKYMVRFYLLALSVPEVEKINWYCWDSTDEGAGSWNMVTKQCTPREVIPAYANMTYNLVGSKFKESLPLNPHQYLFHFERGDEHIYALWSEEGYEGQILLQTKSPVKAVDMWGNSYELSPLNDEIKVTATDEVLFLHSAVPLKVEADSDIFAGHNKVVAGQQLSFTYRHPLLKMVKVAVCSLPGGWKSKIVQHDDVLEMSLLAGKEVKPGRYPVRLLLTAENGKTCGLFDLIYQVSPKVDIVAKPVLEEGKAIGELRLTNNTPEEMNLTVNIGGDDMWPKSFEASELQVALAGYEERRIKFDFPQSLATANQVSTLQILAMDPQGQTYQCKRSFALLYAKRAPGELLIDGDLSDWNKSAGVEIKKWSEGGTKEGYSAWLYTNWDDENLYLGIEVEDGIHYQEGTGGDIWGGDSIQFSIDPFRMKEKAIFGMDGWYEYGGALTKEEPLTWMWVVTMGAIPGKVYHLNFDIKRAGGKTIYEYAIPWKTVAFFQPKVGAYLGFGCLVNQNDGTGREGWLSYCEGIGSIKDANLLGDLILVE